jgi:hypothetical protein
MMPAKLTKRVVEGAKAKTRDVFLWDTEIAGFGVKVTSAGGRFYIPQTRLQGCKRRFTIGRQGSSGRLMRRARKRSDCS